ncbi:hypothetical protein T440DRAFT_263879 [Plenodomus tracheiphilus IPT5]|uniref:Alcohol acetyltransferase n=1 Tax=Plenodomus tracheiphilus IPT5 TaxID=1408161 RepID=A0A6A7AQG9_9PLEO|nr:hypothetical protein T440DRAFT_263879 [Plenodomus tracheiphilus IPT5]
MIDLMKLEKLRTCGRLETFSTARHHLGLYKLVGCTATYTSTKSGASIEQLIFAAVRHVVLKHPNLSAIPISEDQSYPNVYFARLPEIDLRTCVEFHIRKSPLPGDGERDEELEALLTKEHQRDFKHEHGPYTFWRLVVLTCCDDSNVFTASWFFHHALADGASAVIFHESFLAGLMNADWETESEPIVSSPDTALLPPLEELHPMSISWPFFLQAISRALLPSIFDRRPHGLWTGKCVPEIISSQSVPCHRTTVLSAQETTALARACRRETTSVTAALQCLLGAVLLANLPDTEYDRICIQGPMSIRPLLAVKHDQMTNAISAYSYVHTRATATVGVEEESQETVMRHFSWDEARAVKSTIAAVVAKQGRDNPIALLKYVSDMPKYFLDKRGKPRMPSAEMSNIGLWKSKQGGEDDWAIGRMTFSQCPALTSSPMAVNIITGGDGNAVVHFCWNPEAVEERFMDGVIEQFQLGVEALLLE